MRARSRRPVSVSVTMESSSSRASPAVSTGVLPFRTECFGPRTALAGLTGMICPTTSQSKSMRSPARRSLTEGAATRSWRLFDVGGDVHRLDVAQMADAMRAAPVGEAGRGLRVGLARVRIPDMGGEELQDAACGPGIGGKERRELARTGRRDRQRGGRAEGCRQVFGCVRGHFM